MTGFRLINKDDNLLHLECMRSNLLNLPAKSAADKVLIQSYFPLKNTFPFLHNQLTNLEKDINGPSPAMKLKSDWQ